jgi:YVTN family beta-propeller protein
MEDHHVGAGASDQGSGVGFALLTTAVVLLVACGGVPASSPPSTLPSSPAAASPAATASLARSFSDLHFRFDLPDGWTFGSSQDLLDSMKELERLNPEWARRLKAALADQANPTSKFVAYDVSSTEEVTPTLQCTTLDRMSMSVESVLELGETQNLEGIEQLPGLVGSPSPDRLTLPAGETVRIRWQWRLPDGREATSIGYLFVVGPTAYTCTFTGGSGTIAGHEPEWESILRSFDADPAWYVAATIRVGVKPFETAGGFGDIWVANADSGTIQRIDPSTNEITTTIDLRIGRPNGRNEGPYGIVTSADRVWATCIVSEASGRSSDGFAWVIDPATNEAVMTEKVGRTPLAIAVGFGSAWVANLEDGTVSRIDESTLEVTATIQVGGMPQAIAVGAGSVWTGDGGTGTLSRIDPATNRVVKTIEIPSAVYALASGERGIWVGAEGILVRVDPASNRIDATVDVTGTAGLAFADGSVWVAEGLGNHVHEVDDATATITSTVALDTNSWGIAIFHGSVWVVQPAAADKKFADASSGTVTRLDR